MCLMESGHTILLQMQAVKLQSLTKLSLAYTPGKCPSCALARGHLDCLPTVGEVRTTECRSRDKHEKLRLW